ncbi:glycosyltransferase [Pelagibius sp.]|uniref:glycosyltransferase n=1 Tax=Pelagibius sp. TaxID=1931238 RepID=UPI00260EB972|nr:glycosyltransferase [Pelagibius sp.]
MSVNSAPSLAEITPAPATTQAARAPDVLLIISHLGHGGTQRVVCNLANGWSRQGYRVRVLLMSTNRSNAIDLDPAIEQEFLIYRPPSWTIFHLAGLYRTSCWLWKLRRYIRRSKAPVVVSFIRPTNAKVLLACLGLLGRRLVVCERNDPARQFIPPPWGPVSRWLYRTADVVTANSKGVLKTLTDFVPNRKLAYVPNILTPPSETDLKLEAPTILAVGRIVPQKALDVLFKAFAAARSDLGDWRIVILGEGPSKTDLIALAEKLSIDDRIDWPGHVAEPYAYYRASAIFALPSRYEGMPNALLEAMSCGLPVIVSDASPGPLEVVEDERSGLVVPCDDVEATAAALRRLAGDPALRRRLGSAAAERTSGFSRAQALDTWTEVVQLAPPGADRQAEKGWRHLAALKVISYYVLKRQVWGYVFKPSIWPEIWRFLRRKTRIALGIEVEDLAAIERDRQAAVAWCEPRSSEAREATANLLPQWQWVELEATEGGELSAATARVGSVPFRLGGASNMDLLYNLCQGTRAERVIETGVANGWSSLAFLLSLKTRPDARLFSVDLPYLKHHNDRWVGIAVPESLHDRWQLFRMADREGLPRALKAAGTIDLAHYDSDKSPEGRAFAYPLIWQALRPGGLLISDDVGDNTSFRDFCEQVAMTPVIVRQGDKFQGILVKPDQPTMK